jgi:hypothetical protein
VAFPRLMNASEDRTDDLKRGSASDSSGRPLGQKIEAVGNRSIRRSLVGRRAVVGNMQQRIADLAIFVLGCYELHSQNQAQL